MDYIEITIEVQNQDDKDLLIASLSNIGFEGFEEEPRLLKAYISATGFNESELRELLIGHPAEYTKSLIRQRNWNEEWESGFDPVIVGDFCAIRASFHTPVGGIAHEIIITPKMSFGTGHHATTYLMIEAMGAMDISGKTVLDFGTGTGVLAVLSEKLGASNVEALDNDDWSIENGKENLESNGCRMIRLYKSDSLHLAGKADILLANINKNVILQHFGSMKEHLLPGGTLLISGLLTGDLEDIKLAAAKEKMVIREVKERQSWISVNLANE